MQCSALRKNGHVVIKGIPLFFYISISLILNILLSQVVLARLSTCQPLKPVNMVMPKSISSPSMWVHFFHSIISVIGLHTFSLDLHWKEVGQSTLSPSEISWFNLGPQEDICPSTHNMDVPNVHRNEYQLVSYRHAHTNPFSVRFILVIGQHRWWFS